MRAIKIKYCNDIKSIDTYILRIMRSILEEKDYIKK